MKPANDERHEVAARLRNNAGQKPSWVIPWAVFNDAYEHEGAELINRLADLIEPEERTCQRGTEVLSHAYPNEIVCDSDCVSTYVFPLTCGHEVELLENKWPSYCPNCGAKVVDEDA